MPTKLNKAGNQQNYVPAGNGDASGEYGDNADGSNIHFKSFKKPEGETKTEESGFDEINNKRMGTSKPKKEEKPNIENGKIEETEQPKKMTKKEKVAYENEQEFKKSFPNTKVNFKGYGEQGQKNLVESANQVLNDFPTLSEFLVEYGNPNAMNKEEQDYIIKKKLEQITPETIEQRRNKLFEWNKWAYSQEEMEKIFTTEYVENLLKKEAMYKVRTGRASIGKSCAITAHSANSVKSKIYFRNEYIDGEKAKQHAEGCYEDNWWSSNDEKCVSNHELGHALDNYLFSQYFTRTMRDEIRDLYNEELKSIQNKMDQVAEEKGFDSLSYYKLMDKQLVKTTLKDKGEKLFNLSQYGMTDTAEFIAESVAAHYGKMNNPLAEKVFAVLQRAEKELQFAKEQNRRTREGA